MIIDTELAHKLVSAQMPQWAGLEIRPAPTSGWDNRTFRLGSDMSIRLPSAAGYAPQVDKEHYWLPRLAPSLPLAVPRPLAKGGPGCGYPWPWSVYKWIPGDSATVGIISSMTEFATQLAHFIKALHTVNSADGPPAGAHNFHRGGSLSIYDAEVRQALDVLGASVEQAKAQELWSKAINTEWKDQPVWVHGDISAGNLLVRNGQLVAVIDFGGLGTGDPACDLAIAWTFFDDASRTVFRDGLPLDQDIWDRGRGWALWKALIIRAQLPGTNQNEYERAEMTIKQLFTDFESDA